MTQRVFDVENEKDMQDLWDILPDDVKRITGLTRNKDIICIESEEDETMSALFKINWHDKTEITRPIQEATEADIGKICYFWDDNIKIQIYGVLEKIHTEGFQIFYSLTYGSDYKHCRRLTKQEIEELCL